MDLRFTAFTCNPVRDGTGSGDAGTGAEWYY